MQIAMTFHFRNDCRVGKKSVMSFSITGKEQQTRVNLVSDNMAKNVEGINGLCLEVLNLLTLFQYISLPLPSFAV